MDNILIIGGESTGTSIPAGILHRLGVPMGTEEDPDQIYTHPRGNMEDPVLDEILQRGVQQGGFTPREGVELLKWRNERREAADEVWGAKHPLINPFAPFIVPMLSDVHFIVTKRPNRRVAQSLKDKGSVESIEQGLNMADGQLQQAHTTLQLFPSAPRMVVEFEEMLEKPLSTARTLAEFAGVDADSGALEHAANFITNKENNNE